MTAKAILAKRILPGAEVGANAKGSSLLSLVVDWRFDERVVRFSATVAPDFRLAVRLLAAGVPLATAYDFCLEALGAGTVSGVTSDRSGEERGIAEMRAADK